MTESIIAALISGSVTLLVCIINNNAQNKKTRAQHDETMGVMNYKLDDLIKKVEKHNGLVEKTYALEQCVALQEERIKVANHRIDDLEKVKAS